MNSKHPVKQATNRREPTRMEIVCALKAFRREWQQTAGTANLVTVAVPVALVIADIAESLGLDCHERLSVLGADLNAAVTSYLQEPIRLK